MELYANSSHQYVSNYYHCLHLKSFSLYINIPSHTSHNPKCNRLKLTWIFAIDMSDISFD